MARHGSADVPWILIGGHDLVPLITDLEDETEGGLEASHGLGQAWEASLPTGVQQVRFPVQGYYDSTQSAVHEALAASTTPRTVCFGYEGPLTGRRFVGIAGAFTARYRRTSKRGELTKVAVEYGVTGHKDDGVILHPLASETTDGHTDATSVDHGQSSPAGGAGYLQVTSVGLGTASGLVVRVRHSADDATYADLLTFTSVAAAPTAQRATVAGVVNRHLLASWAWTGGAGGGSVAEFLCGFARH